jgi:hypothetical protein
MLQALVTLRMALKQAVVWGLVPRNVAALVDGIADGQPNGGRSRPTSSAASSTPPAATGSTSWSSSPTPPECANQSCSGCAGPTSTSTPACCGSPPSTAATASCANPRPPPATVSCHSPSRPSTSYAPTANSRTAKRAAATEWEDWGLHIATRTGRPVNHANARRSWNRILRTAGVEHREVHHMRHAYVTMLAEQACTSASPSSLPAMPMRG